MFVDGEWVGAPSGATSQVVNPATGTMPWGGFKESGHGKGRSIYPLEEYTEIKHVMVKLPGRWQPDTTTRTTRTTREEDIPCERCD
jgi:acyl-CoA reductase-like NAD-dependent aldehyde dehydrogenase